MPLTSEAWQTGHHRLYTYLCETTPDKPDATLEDLQPLYQAVAHGCRAGLQQQACEKVYRDRILRGGEHFTWHKLGAFGSELGAQASFFEQPWSQVSSALSEPAQAWLLNEAAFCLRALGRLTEALEPMRAALEMGVKAEHWEGAAIRASNLSELELTLGEVAGAVEDASRSVTYADRSGDAFWRMATRATHADALHQAGRMKDEGGGMKAEEDSAFILSPSFLFAEAEALQAESQPAYPLLYSLQGFKYCDLLLAPAERAAWQAALNPKSQIPNPKLVESCHAVTHRATQTLTWTVDNNMALLDIALNHLTLGRAALYEAILEQSKIANQKSQIEEAVSGLRHAGVQDYLIRGLLPRAWFRYRHGERTGPNSAQTDLDEAWEIAERGSMRLFMADVRLYRARLFGMVGPVPTGQPTDPSGRSEPALPDYPWESPEKDLAEARRLIVTCGYGRRMEELEDAEAAL